jgi:hypothetical protein
MIDLFSLFWREGMHVENRRVGRIEHQKTICMVYTHNRKSRTEIVGTMKQMGLTKDRNDGEANARAKRAKR